MNVRDLTLDVVKSYSLSAHLGLNISDFPSHLG